MKLNGEKPVGIIVDPQAAKGSPFGFVCKRQSRRSFFGKPYYSDYTPEV